MNHKHFYAARNYMGLNYTHDSPCWDLFAFDSKKERDDYVNDDQEHTEPVSLKTARKICPWLHEYNPHDNQTGYYSYNIGRKVNHM